MKTASIIGGSGYIGGEILRLICMRDDLELVQITSSSQEGKKIDITHPNLRGYVDINYSSPDEIEDVDIIFSALPHGVSNSMMRDVLSHADHVIDLSADHRLNDRETYKKWYGQSHLAPELLSEFPYGLPEINRTEIARKGRVAAPGCVASSVILGLYPFRDIAKKVIVDSKIGSSASGKSHGPGTHHPERSGVIRPYAPVDHRHRAEVFQETGVDVMMTVHAVEMVRGISTTLYIDLASDLEEKDIWQMFRSEYSGEPFIRIVKSRKGQYRYPEPKLLSGTNFCDIGFELDPRNDRLVVFSALDNLMKGGAGSAMQSLNVILELEERTGLEFPGLHPV